MLSTLNALVHNEDGAALVEYALIVALIAVVALTAVQLIGNRVSTKLNDAANALS
jgi:pilus assembly protein Flp/PilA